MFEELNEQVEEIIKDIEDVDDVESVILSIKFEDSINDKNIIVSKFHGDDGHILDMQDIVKDKIDEKGLDDEDGPNKMVG